MKIKTFLLCTMAVSLSGYSAHGESSTSGPRYTPRSEVSDKNSQTHRTEDRMDAKSYEQYEQREPCQYYRKLPRNYIDTCGHSVVVVEEETMEFAAVQVQAPAPKKGLMPIVNSYTILFDFDKSELRIEENKTLDRVVSEISKYEPEQITVTGYTDSSGAADYNQVLSRKREQVVSKALLTRGIENQTIAREARGEYDQAVKTPDDTRNQENRRVVVDFRR